MATKPARSGDGAVTMADVAARAGVSKATVSRVLSGSAAVDVRYRERVDVAVRDLGYRPNRLARSLRRRQAEMIGVVVSDIENPHFAEMIHAVESEVSRYGYRLLLCNTDESRDKQASYLKTLAEERPRGVILAASDGGAPEIAELLDLGIEVVAFDRPVLDPRADTVLADGEAAARLAVEHLFVTGHRHIVLIGMSSGIDTGNTRLAGFRVAMTAAGLDARWEDGGFRIESGQAATHRALDRWPDCDALIAGNNMIAIGALRALRERHVLVPRDIRLVSFDDPFWAELVDPPLTTLGQPIRAMVAAATLLLMDGIEGRRRQPRRLVFNFELNIRSSSQMPTVSREAAE